MTTIKARSTAASREATGDWRNFKGDYYHLLYVVWLLLHQEGVRVAFYQGNDLIASPAVPKPGLMDGAPILARAESPENEVWIQLKSTTSRWSCTSVINDVLFNFVYNALTSKLNGRKWETRLVTQGQVAQDELQGLVSTLTASKGSTESKLLPKLRRLFNREIKRAFEEWKRDHATHFSMQVDQWTLAHASEVGVEVLRQLAQTQPCNSELMAAQIRHQTLLSCFDPTLAERMENTLIGELAKQASLGPQHARAFDESWMDETAGRALRPRGVWDSNPLTACQEANALTLARDWEASFYVPRPRLEAALTEFLASDAPLFALIGVSGVGKTWATNWMATQLLQNIVRLVLPATELDYSPTLESLVASRLRVLTSASHTDAQLLERWKAAAHSLASQPVGSGAQPLNAFSPVLVLDDLGASRDEEQLRRDLARLVGQAREHGVKIVLTCQEHIWRTSRPAGGISARDIFTLEPISGRNSNQPTLVLGDFSVDELEEAVARRLSVLGSERASNLARQLRAPTFAALRNPFLLSLYLDKHLVSLRRSTQTEPPPLAVDELLDAKVETSLERVAEKLGCDVHDITPAFTTLCRLLWDTRPDGVERNQAIDTLEEGARELGGTLFRQLRDIGLLTPEGLVRLERTPVAERLFAREVRRRAQENPLVLDGLRPEEDGGVVAALLRDLGAFPAAEITIPSNPINDAVMLAEALLQADERWKEAVCEGLAQCAPDDLRLVAMLTALARPRDESLIGFPACRALGRLAARSKLARRWVAQAYIGSNSSDRYRSAMALGELLEFMPRFVTRMVSWRLRLAQKMPAFHAPDWERREKWMQAALDPLNDPRHQAAAQAVQNVVARFGDFVRDSEDWRQSLDLAEVRGGLLALNREERESVFADLESPDVDTRYLAASALRAAAFKDIDQVADVLLNRIRLEDNHAVLSRLLWAAYPLTAPTYAPQFLATLRASHIARWDAPLSVGPALTMLAVLATRDPLGVLDFLPRELNDLDATTQAYLGEVLIHSWWSLADEDERLPATRRDEPRQFLEAVSTRDLADIESGFFSSVPPEERPFAARGVVVAQLALLGWKQIRATEAQMHEFGRDWPHYQADLEAAVGRHAAFLVSQPGVAAFQDALIESARLEAEAPYHHPVGRSVKQESLHSARFSVTTNSLEVLALLLQHQPDPIPALEQLSHESLIARLRQRLISQTPQQVSLEPQPDSEPEAIESAAPENVQADSKTEPIESWQLMMADWEQMRVITRLLELGRRDEPLIELARQGCQTLAQKQSGQGGAERERCLAQLALIRSESGHEEAVTVALEEHREQTQASWFSIDDRVQGFVSLTDGHPERLLQTLDDSTNEYADLVTLCLWHRFTRDWRALLLARVLRRMFDERPIGRLEARRLCHEMLTGLRALPSSLLRNQWITIYDFLEAMLLRQPRPTLTFTTIRTFWGWSHITTIHLLNRAHEEQPTQTEGWKWLDIVLPPRSTLLENHNFKVDKPHAPKEQETRAVFCFPAVRLAAILVGFRLGILDPVGQRMTRHAQLVREMDNEEFMMAHPSGYSQEHKDRSVARVEKFLEEEATGIPRDDNLRLTYLNILLIAGHFERAISVAEAELREAERKKTTGEFMDFEYHASLLYTLACARVLTNDEAGCRRALEDHETLAPLDSRHLMEDPDMASVRETEWFKELVERHREATQNRRRQTRYAIPTPMVVTESRVEGNRFTVTLSSMGRGIVIQRQNEDEDSDETD